MGLNASDVRYVIDKIGAVIEENKDYLTELDSAIGDADHGINMNKGFQAVTLKLKSTDSDDIGNILKAVGMALVSNVGGASGPLYGTAFMKAGAYAAGKKEININDFVSMMDVAIEGIKMRGRAEAGDKTMLDALEPAAASLKNALQEGKTPLEALSAAKESAKSGAEKTKEIAARKGRASYLGERSIGHQDAGATSSYLMLNCIYEAVGDLNYRK
jgi:dihydroxyacetone kinase, phosphoprotein-dependent, L subunit